MAELWGHLNHHQPPLSLSLDEPSKEFLWRQLKRTALASDSVCVYQLPEPRAAKSTLVETKASFGLSWMKYKHPFLYRSVSAHSLSLSLPPLSLSQFFL